MPTAPKISVIVPVYNAGEYLSPCLESICGQTLSDIEIVCVDDGSTDSSAATLTEYAAKDSRIRIISREHSNAGEARNAGLDVAQGEYLSFLDADDLFAPTMLEELLASAKEHAADVVLCRSQSLDVATGVQKPIEHAIRFIKPNIIYAPLDLAEEAFRYCLGWPWDKLFSRELATEHSLRFQSQQSTNDACFVYLALTLARRIVLVDSCLATHRVGNSASIEGSRESNWRNMLQAQAAIQERLQAEGLMEKYERAFLAWQFSMAVWSLVSLSGAAQLDVLHYLQEELIPRMAAYEGDWQLYPREQLLLEALQSSHEELLLHCAAWTGTMVDRDYQRQRVDELTHEIWSLTAQLEDAINHIEALENSKSFKLGRALTAAPRLGRDALRNIGKKHPVT
jgi:glycosyltransferase involved in cell wall biosynthesis